MFPLVKGVGTNLIKGPLLERGSRKIPLGQRELKPPQKFSYRRFPQKPRFSKLHGGGIHPIGILFTPGCKGTMFCVYKGELHTQKLYQKRATPGRLTGAICGNLLGTQRQEKGFPGEFWGGLK